MIRYFESPRAPHHSPIHIENQSNSRFSHSPPESHDPITHALEESYVASAIAKRKFCSFFMFYCLSSLKVCTCFSSTCNVTKHHDTSAACLSCSFNILFFVDTSQLRTIWFELFHLYCMLVCLNIFLGNHAITYTSQPMHWWPHWKYHLTWFGPCSA